MSESSSSSAVLFPRPLPLPLTLLPFLLLWLALLSFKSGMGACLSGLDVLMLRRGRCIVEDARE